MGTTELVKRIKQLPVEKRISIVRQTLKSIRAEAKSKMERAASALKNDYAADKELTAFTGLDLEDFYEAR